MKSKYLAAVAALVVAGGAHAASATFSFNLPAVGNNAVRPPYPTVATLTLVDVAGGVQFTLDPNEASSGFAGDASSEFVERLTLAYGGVEPLSFSNVAGAALRDFSFGSQGHLDAGYASNGNVLSFDWFSSRRDGANRFDITESSAWNLSGDGLDVSDFTSAREIFTPLRADPGATAPFVSARNVAQAKSSGRAQKSRIAIARRGIKSR